MESGGASACSRSSHLVGERDLVLARRHGGAVEGAVGERHDGDLDAGIHLAQDDRHAGEALVAEADVAAVFGPTVTGTEMVPNEFADGRTRSTCAGRMKCGSPNDSVSIWISASSRDRDPTRRSARRRRFPRGSRRRAPGSRPGRARPDRGRRCRCRRGTPRRGCRRAPGPTRRPGAGAGSAVPGHRPIGVGERLASPDGADPAARAEARARHRGREAQLEAVAGPAEPAERAVEADDARDAAAHGPRSAVSPRAGSKASWPWRLAVRIHFRDPSPGRRHWRRR